MSSKCSVDFSWLAHLSVSTFSNGLKGSRTVSCRRRGSGFYWRPRLPGTWQYVRQSGTNLSTTTKRYVYHSMKFYFKYEWYTQLQKKVYMHFEFQWVGTQNLGHASPMTDMTDHWSSNPNKTEFAKKIQSGSKVVKQSLKACTLSASNIEVNGKNRFLCTFWRNFPINFSLELWNHLEFCHKPKLNCCTTLIGSFSNL